MRLLLLATCFPGFLAAQDPGASNQDRGSISGTVVNSVTGAPLRKAQVVLRPFSSAPELPESHSITTDAGGNFSFSGLDPGTYMPVATLTAFSRARQQIKPILLERGGKQTGITLKLVPQGVITGRVTDQDGDPLMGANVQVMRRVYQNGKRSLVPAGSANTNDRGEYRVYGLTSGKYFLSAQYRGSGLSFSDDSYPVVYYPNVRNAEAAALLDVPAGVEVQGMDMALTKGKSVRIRGLVLDANDRPLSNVFVRLVPSSMAVSFSQMSIRVNDKGAFTIASVAPGGYRLMAEVPDEKARMTGSVTLEVGEANIDGVTIRIEPTRSLPGRLLLEGKPDFAFPNLTIFLESKTNAFGGVGGPAKPDGSFTLANVGREAYGVNVFVSRDDLYLKSVRFGEQDVTETGLDFTQGVIPAELTVTLSGAGAQVSGTVQNENGDPTPSAHVVLVPDAPKRTHARLFKTALTDPKGNFTIRGVSPGDYKLFAWDDLEPGAHLDPDFLKPFESQGDTVTVKENARESRQLKLIHNSAIE